MPRSRVLSFMTAFGGGPRSPTSEEPLSEKTTPTASTLQRRQPSSGNIDVSAAQGSSYQLIDQLNASAPGSPGSPTGPSRSRGDSKAKRMSMLQPYNPPQVEVANDTPPELAPIFTYLNSHSNKLYQEGYFLKLHDLDSRGRPSADRVWTECFAQLIGTVLSLWDAAALDVAGEDAEVVPTFINLSDAAIKMIESLPMNGAQGGNLQNVLSISTAANNRYLLHFNTLNSLTQWTAGIRLAMFEHSTLQEAYTGSLIAGKGKNLNNIKQIMFRLQFAHEDWARVRFGAGTPWKRCWCVISPPDEKEWNKAQKAAKKAPYEKTKMPKGDIKFYDTRKVTKKTKPIATITDAYAAYAIYPQSKPLIEQSTLVKVEGVVTTHGPQEDSTVEGFVFVMPEVHQAVTGFEMMLRWLFPCFDTFQLYGRPTKLIADTLDQKGLMFALPNTRRYGYLDTLDVSGLIHTKGSHSWTERQWRREMKKLTADRMVNQMEGTPRHSSQQEARQETRRRNTDNLRPGVRFGDDLTQSTPGSRTESPVLNGVGASSPVPRTDSAPPDTAPHRRAASEAYGYKRNMTDRPSLLSQNSGTPESEEGPLLAPAPPQHGAVRELGNSGRPFAPGALERINSGTEVPTQAAFNQKQELPPPSSSMLPAPAPVGPPPAFVHPPNSRPTTAPHAPPELRRANSQVDAATLYQMQEATRPQEPMPELDLQWQRQMQLRQQQQQNTVASSQPPARAFPSPELSADRSQGAVNRMPQQRDVRQRLSTIPGSPFVSEPEHAFQSFTPQLDGAVDFAPPDEPPPPPPRDSGTEESLESSAPIEKSVPPERSAPSPPPIHSTPSILRKPVPRSKSSDLMSLPSQIKAATPPPVPTSGPLKPPGILRTITQPLSFEDDWEGAIIDEAALERQLNMDRTETLHSDKSTDYASTIDEDDKKPTERRRAGKMKVVGDPSVIPAMDVEKIAPEPPAEPVYLGRTAPTTDIPGVDFGPTYQLKPTIGARPNSSLTMRPEEMTDRRRSKSADRLAEMARENGASSPNDNPRLSYISSTNTNPLGRVTPDSEKRSSVVWQPGSTPANLHRAQTSLTPEEWVQQRATMAQQPQYAPPPKKTTPERYGSDARRRLTKTPPLSRNVSGDYAQARPSGPPRPSSRGAGMILDTVGHQPSATEQMQISRSTGEPLISLANNTKDKAQEPQAGLVGAVAQREREKVASREGRNSMFVQQAIEAQQRQTRMEAEAQQAQVTQAQYQQHQQQYELEMQRQQQVAYEQHVRMQQQQQMEWSRRQSWVQSQPPQPRAYGESFQQQQQQQQMQQQPQAAYGGQSAAPSQYGGVYTPQGRPPPPPYGASFTGQAPYGGRR